MAYVNVPLFSRLRVLIYEQAARKTYFLGFFFNFLLPLRKEKNNMNIKKGERERIIKGNKIL